jgi:hypothetical protein
MENFLWRKPLIGSIFIAICIFGSVAALLPNQCSKFFKKEKINNKSKAYQLFMYSNSLSMNGHHPSCEKYKAHTFSIKNKTFCAACIGLFVGGLVTTVGSFFYFFIEWVIIENSILFVILGILAVGFGFFQQWFKSIIRLSLNFVFVLGSFFILIGIDKLIHSIIIDLFVISLILFWLSIRVSLSHWDHERICSSCKVVDCEFIN